jgi:hypothetical protein
LHSLAGQAKKEAYNKIARIALLREDGRYSEEEIAQKAGFGSAEAMHTQLSNWGLHGLVPEEAEASSQPPKQRKAKAGSQGVAIELPRPVGATALFEKASKALHQIIEDLEHYRLVLKGGRSINTHFYNALAYLPRSSFTPAQWQELCKASDQDPNSSRIMDVNAETRDPAGGGKYPPRPLVNLIAIYALLGRDVRALLNALHLDPSTVDGTRISGLLYKTQADNGRDGLVRTAEQLAELVCGGSGRRGSPPPYHSAREQNVACSITEYREQGWSNDDLWEHYVPLGFSKERILQLGQLGLRWPED